jgi:hypothetical protein
MNTPFFDHARTKLGVKPAPMPPVYDPQAVSDAILLAAVHPRREIIVGGAGKLVVSLHRHFPRLVDAAVGLLAFRGQRSGEPRTPEHENNLWASADGDTRIRGDESLEARGGPAPGRRRRGLLRATAAATVAGTVAAALGALWAIRRVLRRRRGRRQVARPAPAPG